jgi:hypothetical protein
MTADAEVEDVSIILRTSGKSVRLGSADKWRRAISLRDLKRETVVGLDVGGVAMGDHAAGAIQALRPIFDELDPPPVAIALAQPPAEVRADESPANDLAAIEEPERLEPPPPSSQPSLSTLVEAVKGTPPPQSIAAPARARAKPGAAAGWLWLALIGAAFLVLAIKAGMAQSNGGAVHPPYPITLYPTPRHEQVEPVGLNLHTGPGVSYPKMGSGLDRATIVTAFGDTTAADGGRWEYVQTPAGPRGYVNGRLLAPSP